MIKMVVFDMAGTTIDEDNIVYKCLTNALNEYKVDVDLDTVLVHAAGREKLDAIKNVYKEKMNEIIEDEFATIIFNHFNTSLTQAYDKATLQLFNGVKSMLYFLSKLEIKIVFNTGFKHHTAFSILKSLDLYQGKDYDLLVTADMVKNHRPYPDMINYALNHFHINPNECIKVGDSVVDILEGKNAKVKYSIGITTGAQDREALLEASPDFIIDHISELMNIINDTNDMF